MYIFEYEQQQFISLKDIVERIGLRLDQLITLDKAVIKYLCFFYCGIVYNNEGKPSRHKGIVYPDSNLILTSHLKAALKHSPLYYTPTEDEYGQKQKEEEAKLFLKSTHKDYEDAFLDAGKASQRNTYNYAGRYTIPTFYLQDYILPYYVLPVDYMTSFFKNHNMEDATSNSKVELKKLNELKTIQKPKPQNYPILDGDILKALLESLQNQLAQAQEEINTLKDENIGLKLKQTIEQAQTQKLINDKETQLQTALETIKQLEVSKQSASEDSPSSAALRLAGAFAIDAYFIDIHSKRFNGIGDMKKALDILGVRVDEDSMRTVFKLAAEKIDKINIRKDHPAYKK